MSTSNFQKEEEFPLKDYSILSSSIDDKHVFINYVIQQLDLEIDEEPSANVIFIANKMSEMSNIEAFDIITRHSKYHKGDSNIPHHLHVHWSNLLKQNISEKLDSNDNLFDSSNNNILDLRYHAAMFQHWSPYIEVRSVTDPIDDPTLPVETVRAYIAAIIWLIIGAGMNQFFSVRMPAISISSMVCQLLLYPTGKLMEWTFPKWEFTLFGTRISLNPGPWNNKEQIFATMFISVAIGGTYITSYNLFVQILPMYYNTKWARSIGYTVLLTLSSQFMGFGFAGLLRKFVVYPTKAVWPTLLPTLALNRTLLLPTKNEKVNGWSISTYNFFFLISCCTFVYFWFPSYLFQALSYFNWMTWIAPNNVIVNIITGSNNLGINPIPTFDPNFIFGVFNPLIYPMKTILNIFSGMVLGSIVIGLIYWTNLKWTAYLPINSNRIFDNTGSQYKVSNILIDNTFNEAKYRKYSPPFYTAANLLVYYSFFAIYTLGFSYICLVEYLTMWECFKDIWTSIRGFFSDAKETILNIFYKRGSTKKTYHRPHFASNEDEPFSRMIFQHKEVSNIVYLIILCISFVIAVIAIKVWPTQTPIWGLFFCLGINLVFLIPLTLMAAYTGFTFGLNVLVQLIVGYALPGYPQVMMILKAIGYNLDGQAQNFITDQKIAYYAHIPPRALMRSQLFGTLLGAFVCIGVLYYQLEIEGICTPEQAKTTRFICVSQNTFFSASVIWGAFGPARMFKFYPAMRHSFLYGTLLGIFVWAIQYPIPDFLVKKFPHSKDRIINVKQKLQFFNPVVFVGGLLNFAPYNLTFATGGLYLSFLFQWIKLRYKTWWSKYTYTLDAGLTTGIAFSAIIVFFALQFKGISLDWWGNEAPFSSLDFNGVTLLKLAKGETFGPLPKDFP